MLLVRHDAELRALEPTDPGETQTETDPEPSSTDTTVTVTYVRVSLLWRTFAPRSLGSDARTRNFAARFRTPDQRSQCLRWSKNIPDKRATFQLLCLLELRVRSLH